VFALCVYPVLAQAPITAKIAFTSNREGNSEIYIMNPDGSEPVNLTRHRANDFSPTRSPTGEQILFVSDRGKTSDLYLMDADGRRSGKFSTKHWIEDTQLGHPMENV